MTGSAILSGETFDPWTELLQKLRQATIGEYEIKGELGRGGMAAVFLAHDLHLNRKVAVKVMLPGLVYGERMWDRFLAEARTAAKLDHPNIVYIHSVKEKDRFLFFVMKYIDGRPLDDLLAQHKPIPIPVAQTILVEVARALDYAHHEGVVHRDIKPANIMIDQKGAAIVMDFGIARAVDSQHFTQTGATIGTPAYMSPEQCHGDDTTAASDQYSLGILAYEMFGGTPPFKGTPIELQVAHMQNVPAPLRDLRPDLSLELSGAVMRMLEKRPQERWPSLQHLVPIFARALDPHDEAPRNHLISLVRSGTPRRKSFPATPISPTPLDLTRPRPLDLSRATPLESRTPVADYRARPSSPTTPVTTAELAAAEDELAKRSAEAAIVSGSRDAPTVIGGPQPALGAAAPQPSWGAPSGPSPARARSRRPAAIVAGAVVLLGVAGMLATRGTKAPPAPVPPPTADSTPAAPTAAAVVEAALGDSVVIGHGADATARVGGKTPRVVSPDAVAMIQVSLARSRIAVGDTVHAKIEAFDDAGQRVTTPQMVQSTSNPRVVKFAGPGELVGVKEGKATLTVSAGATTATREVIVQAKSEGRRAKSAPQKKSAPGI
jgi:serine/threonine-protein kinase